MIKKLQTASLFNYTIMAEACLSNPEKVLAYNLALAFLSSGSMETKSVFEENCQNNPKLIDKENRILNDVPLKTAKEKTDKSNRIGIWKLEDDNGKLMYARDKHLSHEWHYWSDTPGFTLKSNNKRIVWTGESVARGYLYDPLYNPARALKERLATHPGIEETEVIDLARNGMDMQTLTEVCIASMSLEPDALIVFAGNNWLNSLLNGCLQEEELSTMRSLAEKKTFPAFKDLVETKLQDMIRTFMKCLHDLTLTRDVRVIFVIPEYNLLNWKSSLLERRIGWFNEDDYRKWMQWRSEAMKCLETGFFARADELGTELIRLDSTNPFGYEVLAQCRLAENNHEEARFLLQQAKDTALFGRANSNGRNLTICRDAVKDLSAQYGFSCIDLPEIFREHLKGNVPGRELFLDYCHMTIEGIEIAIEHIADCLAQVLYKVSASSFAKPGTVVPGDLTAMAHIFAAIHNSHNGQEQNIVLYHCMKAVEESGSACKFMMLYASMANRKLSNILCRNYEAIISNGFAEQYGQGRMLLHPRNGKIMDIELVNTIAASLRAHGIDIQNQVRELRIREHAIDAGKTDLLLPFYHNNSYQDSAGPRRGYYLANDPESRFHIITNEPVPLIMELCCRVPANSNGGVKKLAVLFNDVRIAELIISRKWQTYDLDIPAALLNTGINNITLLWPSMTRSAAVDQAGSSPAYSLEDVYCSLYPFFGEIHSFLVRKNDNITNDSLQ